MVKQCPACHEQLPMDARFCGACGFRIATISSTAYQRLAADKRSTGAPIEVFPDAAPDGSTLAPIPLTQKKIKRPAAQQPVALTQPKPKPEPAAAQPAPAPAPAPAQQLPQQRRPAPAPPGRRPESLRRLGDPASQARTNVREVLAPQTEHDTGRRSRRFPLKVEVDYGSEHNFYTGFLENISSGGLFIATHQLREIGDIIDVQFSVPGLSRPISATVKVRWLREDNPSSDAPPGMGCQFGPLEPDAKAAIELFLKHREPIFFDD